MKNQEIIIFLKAPAEAPEWFRVLPLGEVKLADNREPLVVDRESLETVTGGFRQRGVDLVIDYEHQSLSGGRAPAAGWIKELEVRADGLWARADWTAPGAAYLGSREYRYFSPVLRLDPETRKPVALLHVALTNVPAIQGLQPLAAKWGGEDAMVIILREFSAEEREKMAKSGEAMPDGSFPIKSREDVQNAVQAIGRAQDPEAARKHIVKRAQALDCMDVLPEDWPGSTKKRREGQNAMKHKLINLLQLKAEATDEEIFTAAQARLEELAPLAAALPEMRTVLALKADDGASVILGAVKGLKEGQAALTKVQAEMAALKAQWNDREAQDAVDHYQGLGKILPAEREHCLKEAQADVAAFKARMEARPVIGPPTEQLGKPPEKKPGAALDQDDLAVCKATGVDPEKYKAERDKGLAA